MNDHEAQRWREAFQTSAPPRPEWVGRRVRLHGTNTVGRLVGYLLHEGETVCAVVDSGQPLLDYAHSSCVALMDEGGSGG